MASSQAASVRLFRPDVPQHDLDDLYDRLDRTRWPDGLPGTGWACGVPPEYLRELVHHRRHAYDWRAAEARLNEWPQFTTTIDGAHVHFAHVRSPEPDAVPLITTHGGDPADASTWWCRASPASGCPGRPRSRAGRPAGWRTPGPG